MQSKAPEVATMSVRQTLLDCQQRTKDAHIERERKIAKTLAELVNGHIVKHRADHPKIKEWQWVVPTEHRLGWSHYVWTYVQRSVALNARMASTSSGPEPNTQNELVFYIA